MYEAQEMKMSSDEQNDKAGGTELSDSELDAVSGGLVVNAIIAVLIGQLVPSVQRDGSAFTPDQLQQLKAGNPIPRPR